MSEEEIVFGPVPSRRLGLSLGVNNVFSKYCTYSCVYCQVGRTDHLIIERRKFYEPEVLAREVVRAYDERKPDVVTFVPNGEPTLDVNLGIEARLIKERRNSAKLAILTNASLMYRNDVREDLMYFDIVSVKVDAVNASTWRRINRPHPKLKLEEILDGIRVFSKEFKGKLISETMIVDGINDSEDEFVNIAKYLKELKDLYKAYIMVPVRPPAEPWVKPPSEEKVIEAYNIFTRELGEGRVELIISPEPPQFKFLGDLAKEIVKTVNVHPLRLSYVIKMATDRGKDPQRLLEELITAGGLKIVEFSGEKFLVPRTRK
jgi:wyosine [tRNA(Phe)-imidazoG37] synthetase (radical SAM superfamily)